MRHLHLGWLGLIAALIPSHVVAAAAEPLSPRNASYEIHVALDPAARTLTGSQVLTWRNVQESATEELRFHLYWNAWRNDASTWMRERRLRGRQERDIREEDWGWIQVDSVRLLPGGGREETDLTSAARHAWPDDGNEDDRTVLAVDLPGPVAPGETIRVEMTWRAKVPRTFARTGHRGDYFFLAHWFPKLGVFEAGGWNCHQFHAATEFFSDFGVYDVHMTVPEEFVLGATGRQKRRTDNGDGTVTYRHVQEDVHAFTWTASPDYVVLEERFEEPGLPPVDMRLLMQPEHLGQAERHFAATRAALEHYGNWYGPYPYGHVTVVDPAYGSGAGGMEYPTLFTCGTSLFNPPGGDSPEGVTIHEAGHQFWYGLVGNNEFEHAWIDEGLNTFSTGRTLDVAYGERLLVRRFLSPPRSGRGFLPVRYPGITVDRWVSRLEGYRPAAASDVPATATYRYHPATAAGISYSKTALWLRTLENHLGWETLQEILSTFFERYRFGHPAPEDFLAVAAEVAGEDLDWFFDQVFRDSVIFDYAIGSVASTPVSMRGFVEEEGALAYRGAEPDADPELAEGPFRTEVVVQRRGDGEFPVQVLLVFEDGHKVREDWDGKDTWTLITVEHATRLDYAVVDPERVLMLDIDITNNSLLREPASTLPASKWGGKWMIWLQDLLHTMTFFG